MIRVLRGAEPDALQTARRRGLSRAILKRREGQGVDFAGYEAAKDALVFSQHEKCAFCEKDVRREGSPVEHFRPKDRYWWLAWTWENLLLACFRCNTSCKGRQFPLMSGTPPLPELSFELAAERPLLLDPTAQDPREHIRFRWSETRQRWLPVPRSPQGQKTVEILRLDDDDHPTSHVQDRVMLCVQEIKDRMREGDPAKVKRTWARWMVSLFAKRQPFHAVTWDALDHSFPATQRARWGLELPSLGDPATATAPASPTFIDPPEFAHLHDEVLRHRVRALGESASQEVLRPVLDDVLALRPWSDEELASLFERSPETIRTYRAWLRQGP